MKKEYQLGKRYHNDKFIGWAIWWTHRGCTKNCCPKTIAEFYGKGSFQLAKKTMMILTGN